MVKNASESSDRFCNFNLTDLSMYICTVSQAGYISLAICTVSFLNVFKTSLWWTCLWVGINCTGYSCTVVTICQYSQHV